MAENIEILTVRNTDYRRVIRTTDQMQIVLMSLAPGEDIPTETHRATSQFIRIEGGDGVVIVGRKVHHVGAGSFVVVPAGKRHYVANISDNLPLKLYTVYAPPEHAPSRHNTRQPRH